MERQLRKVSKGKTNIEMKKKMCFGYYVFIKNGSMILNILNAGAFLLQSMFNNLLKLYIFPNDLFVLFIGL